MRHDEDKLTIAVASYLRLQYPSVLFCHIPNGGKRNAIEGARFKRMGVKAGMPDILIFKRKIKCNLDYNLGLAIELKVGKNKQTENQINVQEQLQQEGWLYKVCYSFDEAKNVIDNYLK